MMDTGIHNLVADCGLKGMRICEFPIKTEESIVIDDRLEEEGRLRLYEHIGGNLYINAGMPEMDNITLVAELGVEKDNKGELTVRKLYYEYGYDELAAAMMGQAIHFADFYGLRIQFSGLEKEAS